MLTNIIFYAMVKGMGVIVKRSKAKNLPEYFKRELAELQKVNAARTMSYDEFGIVHPLISAAFQGVAGFVEVSGPPRVSGNIDVKAVLSQPLNDRGKRHTLITGFGGVGKTHFVQYIATRMGVPCFYMPIQRLVERTMHYHPINYDPANNEDYGKKAYSLADILHRECFPSGFKGSKVFWRYIEAVITANEDAYYALEAEVLGEEAPGKFQPLPSVCVIADGWDERGQMPGYLKDAFNALIQSPWLIVASRPFGLDKLSEEHGFVPGQKIEVTGFCKAAKTKAVDALFARKDNQNSEPEARHALIKKTPGLWSLCDIPLFCTILCRMTYRYFSEKSEDYNVRAYLFSIFTALLIRRVRKFERLKGSWEDLDNEQMLEMCQYELAVAEYAAFIGLARDAVPYSELAGYLPEGETGDSVGCQIELGFMEPYEAGEIQGFRFKHVALKHLMAARYIATGLQILSGLYDSPLSHYFNRSEENLSRLRTFLLSEEFQPIKGLVEYLLKENKYILKWLSCLPFMNEMDRYMSLLATKKDVVCPSDYLYEKRKGKIIASLQQVRAQAKETLTTQKSLRLVMPFLAEEGGWSCLLFLFEKEGGESQPRISYFDSIRKRKMPEFLEDALDAEFSALSFSLLCGFVEAASPEFANSDVWVYEKCRLFLMNVSGLNRLLDVDAVKKGRETLLAKVMGVKREVLVPPALQSAASVLKQASKPEGQKQEETCGSGGGGAGPGGSKGPGYLS